jgi:hypothetical protein
MMLAAKKENQTSRINCSKKSNFFRSIFRQDKRDRKTKNSSKPSCKVAPDLLKINIVR